MLEAVSWTWWVFCYPPVFITALGSHVLQPSAPSHVAFGELSIRVASKSGSWSWYVAWYSGSLVTRENSLMIWFPGVSKSWDFKTPAPSRETQTNQSKTLLLLKKSFNLSTSMIIRILEWGLRNFTLKNKKHIPRIHYSLLSHTLIEPPWETIRNQSEREACHSRTLDHETQWLTDMRYNDLPTCCHCFFLLSSALTSGCFLSRLNRWPNFDQYLNVTLNLSLVFILFQSEKLDRPADPVVSASPHNHR
jgi:hypothetical protein